MSIASLGTSTNSALTQVQGAHRHGHHGAKSAQKGGGGDLLSQIEAKITGQTSSAAIASGTNPQPTLTPAAALGRAAGGVAASLGQLGTDVLSILGVGGSSATTPSTAASAYASAQSSL